MASSSDRFDTPTLAPSSGWKPPTSRPMASAGFQSAAAAALSPIDSAPVPNFGPRYRVDGKLGEGGMGSVFKAYDLELDRVVALKVIRQELMANVEILQRFKQELLLASRISHKNILRIHDLGEGSGVKFISMAYVEGQNLAELLQAEKVLPLDRAIDIAKQMCHALAAAHREGVVHRDLKPQNILIDQAQGVYVSDFGLAKSLESDSAAATAMTSVGQVLGTPRYMSPEQVECGAIDGRTDIYSFGLMLYEMVTGNIPFQGNSLQLMLGRVQSMPRNPSLMNSKLPPYLAGIIMRCLEKEPARRYSTFLEVLEDLESSTCTPPGRSRKRKTAIWETKNIVIGAVLLIVAAIPVVRHYLPVLRGTRIQLGQSAPQMSGKHVAVVPFRVVGTDPKLDQVALGVTEALNARLFQVKGITPVSSSAAASSNVKPTDAPDKIGRALGANLLLLGSVQGEGDRVRLDLSLWDASANGITWTKEVSGMAADVLTLEDEIYGEVVKGLNVGPESDASFALHPTENTQAYDSYLHAQTIMRAQQDPEHVQSAIELYNQAIKSDPQFALAYAGLAHADIALYQKLKDGVWASRALIAAQKAAELNAQLPEVHFALGSAYSIVGRNSQSIAELKKAIEIRPESDEGYRLLGGAYAAAGQSADAIESFKKAVKINPYYWPNYNRLGIAYYSLGDYENAIAALSKVVEIDPGSGFGYGNLGNALLQAGKFKQAVPSLQKALQIAPTPARNSNLGTAYYYLQEYDLAIELFDKAVQTAPTSWMYVGNLADAYRLAGKKVAADGNYEKAIGLAKKDLAVNPRSATTMGGLGLWSAKKGDVEQGRRLIAGARTIDPTNVDLMYFQAQIAALANDHPAALTALREAFQKGLRPAIAVAEPDLRNLRTDPQFEKLVREFSHT